MRHPPRAAPRTTSRDSRPCRRRTSRRQRLRCCGSLRRARRDGSARAARSSPPAPPAAPIRASRGARAGPRWRGCEPCSQDAPRSRARSTTGDGSRAAQPWRYGRSCLSVTPARHIDTVDGDVAVIGAGPAGLYAAVVAAAAGARVVLVSSSPLAQSASYWAQGGIAAALAADDSVELHLSDTLKAGRALSRESAARVLCDDSPERVRHLQELGVHFDADRHRALALGLEGGHSRRRVVHAGGSATGRRITRDLSALAATDPNIRVLERTSATSLACDGGRSVGVHARDPAGSEVAVRARATILATGAAAALWARTTTPAGVVGAGMSLALAAGSALADVEFQQFHPTAL